MLERFKTIVTSTKWKTFLRWVLRGLLLSFGVWLGNGLFKLLVGTQEQAWDYLFRQTGLLLKRPIGFVLLLFVGWVGMTLAILLYQSWKETRPPKPNTPSEEELETLRKENLELTNENRATNWWLQYRINRPSPHPLTRDQLREANTEIARLEFVLRPLSERLERLTNRLLIPMWEQGEGSQQNHYATLCNDALVQPTRGLLALLRSSTPTDSRLPFAAFLERYKDLRKWMTAVANFQGKPLHGVEDYAHWRDADEQFITEIGRLPNIPVLLDSRNAVRLTNLTPFPPSPPPDLPNT